MGASYRRARSRMVAWSLAAAWSVSLSASAGAGEVQVAVASNFTAPMKEIAALFEKDTGHKALLAFGGSGKFYAQIKHGAPFEVLLSADDEIPGKLAREGAALGASQFTYARGRLVLWSANPALVDARAEVLRRGAFDHIAVANPKLAPYGAAAVEVMQALGVHAALQARLVTGENIGQTFQFVKSGNAALGFVALSQVSRHGRIGEGSAWVVPADLYRPIRQDAIMLKAGQGKPAAAALMKYLQGDKARAVIRAYGYDLE
jgi:molybdate transport system substrate-binding protein